MVIFLFLIIIPISLFAIYPSFHLGLYGDDWLVFWRFFYTAGTETYGYLGYLGHLFSRYGSFELLMGFLAKLFGYESVYFYLAAYILRLIASLSFYPLVNYLTKSKVSSLFAVVFFSVTVIGLDATNWVFNMPAYLAITFSNLFLYFLIRSRFEENDKLFAASLVFFALAILTAFIRMTGLIPTIVLLYFFWFIRRPNKIFLSHITKQLLAIILMFFLIVLIGNSLTRLLSDGISMTGTFKSWTNLGNDSLSIASNMLNQGKDEFILYPFLMIGNMLIPIELTETNKWYLTSLGFLLFVLGLIILIVKWKDDLIASGVFLSLSWLILSFFFAWVRTPDLIFPFTHRYFIVSAAGLAIFLAMLTSVNNKLLKTLMLGFFIFILVLNIYSSRKYLTNLVENSHGAEISKKIWSQIPYIPEVGKTPQPLIFYFEGEERGVMHGVITFGFPYHMGLLYGQDDYYKMPLPMDEWKSLVSAVTDGQSLIPYGHPPKPLPLNNIYAFRLEGKDKLIDITDEIRLKLSTLK